MRKEKTLVSYEEIISCINDDFKELDGRFNLLFEENTSELDSQLRGYLFSSSKRLRSAMVFLLAGALGGDYNCLEIASAVELIHNATLIHDDIIDDAPQRRSLPTLSYAFDSKLAVVAGDFLLSLALDELLKCSVEVCKIFTCSLKKVCVGEISQYFDNDKIVSIDSYVEKSKKKTAVLFEAALLSVLEILNKTEFSQKVSNFAINFGIAFQIRDDLINVLKTDDSKPKLSDYRSGIYTAPIIFLANKRSDFLSLKDEELIFVLKSSGAIEDTNKLIECYMQKAIDSLDFIDVNYYKQSIEELCRYMLEVI